MLIDRDKVFPQISSGFICKLAQIIWLIIKIVAPIFETSFVKNKKFLYSFFTMFRAFSKSEKPMKNYDELIMYIKKFLFLIISTTSLKNFPRPQLE